MKKLVYLLGLVFLCACGGAKEKKAEEHGAADAHGTEKVEEKVDELNADAEEGHANTHVRGEAPAEGGHENTETEGKDHEGDGHDH